MQKTVRTVLLTPLAALALQGCRVGPRYSVPAPPAPPAYKEAAPSAYRSADGSAWPQASPADALKKGKWWEIFHEPELNALEERLNIDNQNIARYFQNLIAARAQVNEARSGYFPTVSLVPGYSRSKTPGALKGITLNNTVNGGAGAGTSGTTGASGSVAATSSGTTSTAISLPVDISWAPDLWGRIRNQVSQYRSTAQVSAADLENERLIEQASLAQYYFALRGQDSLQTVYDGIVKSDRESLDLTQNRVAAGIDSPEAVAQAEATLANAVEASSGVATNRALYEHAIATLMGEPASALSLPVKELSTPLPRIPLGVPSELLQRRPDIAAAVRTMAAANAAIGFEKAAYYPALSLSGRGGVASSQIGSLFSAPALLWSLGATASQTVFDAGLRRATVAQYTANFNADAANYRQTVLTAFQQVEDSIATVRILSQQIAQQQAAVDAAQRYVAISLQRYRSGLDPYLNVVSAQANLLADRQIQVALRTNQMTAAVQLIQALGGGWDTADLKGAVQ